MEEGQTLYKSNNKLYNHDTSYLSHVNTILMFKTTQRTQHPANPILLGRKTNAQKSVLSKLMCQIMLTIAGFGANKVATR